MDTFITDYQAAGAGAVALEDSIMHKDRPVTAGSKILEGFTSPFDATVVTRLLEQNVPLAGKTTMREFGIERISPNKPDELTGAVQAVKNNAAGFSLCNDVFGTYRRQAAEQGLCYIHPTYGTVSRFGLIPLVSSMDQIGIVCKSPAEGFQLLSRIAGHDEKDGAMFPDVSYTYKKTDKAVTICAPAAVVGRAEEGARESIGEFCGKFSAVNNDLEYFSLYKQAMYILSCAEISNNISRYDGVKFGYRSPHYKNVNDLYLNTRTEGFGLDCKLAAIMGCLVLSQDQYVPLYEKAMKLRRLIKQSLRFDMYDVIILPTSIGEDPYENLSLFALATLAGLPSVSVSYRGHGVQLVANAKNEAALLAAWEVAVS